MFVAVSNVKFHFLLYLDKDFRNTPCGITHCQNHELRCTQPHPGLKTMARSQGTHHNIKWTFVWRQWQEQAPLCLVIFTEVGQVVGWAFTLELYHCRTYPSYFGSNRKHVAVFCSHVTNGLDHLILRQKWGEKMKQFLTGAEWRLEIACCLTERIFLKICALLDLKTSCVSGIISSYSFYDYLCTVGSA